MRILWLCNIVLPSVAQELDLVPSNKEGWLSGICDAVKKNHDFELGVCFPVKRELDGFNKEIDGIKYYGFFENTDCPEIYDSSLEEKLGKIVDSFKPDIVHIFGTEFPHTLAMCKCFSNNPERLLIGIQGMVGECALHYVDGVPQYVINRRTFRDILRKDSIKLQVRKFELRAKNEEEALLLSGNVTGRTPADKVFSKKINPDIRYFHMNETLRKEFYEEKSVKENVEAHSIFFSQGNYPIKGLHYMLEAMPKIVREYPDTKLYVAGDKITSFESLKDKIKISSYGKYLRELIKHGKLEDKVIFTGNVSASEMKALMERCELFVCASTIENSPNSLGEAMLLRKPCVAAMVGGIPGIFTENKDGLGFQRGDIEKLSECVLKLFNDKKAEDIFSENAYKHALETHNPKTNYSRLLEIYGEIAK